MAHNLSNALLAQLDRVVGFEPIGRGFESLRVRHSFSIHNKSKIPELRNLDTPFFQIGDN
jgi:hypothetical protein